MNTDFILTQAGYYINLSRDLIFVVLYIRTIKSNRVDYRKRRQFALSLLILISLLGNFADQYFYEIIFDSFNSKWSHAVIAFIRNLINSLSFFIYIYIHKELPKRVVLYDALLISSICMACHNIFLTPVTKPVLDVTVNWVDNEVINWLLCLVVLNALSCLIYYIVSKFIPLNNIKDIDTFRMMLLICLFSVSMYLNCTVKNIEFINGEHSMQLSGYIILLCFVFLVLIGYFEYYQRSIQVQNYMLLEKQAIYSLLCSIEKEQENDAMLHQMCHDFRNHLISLRFLIDNHEREKAIKYIESLSKEYLSGQTRIRTGNLIIDGILSHKMKIAETNSVNISVSADFSSLNFMDNTDLCIIFGNLLDNAIEACLKIKEDFRVINLRGYQVGETMIYSMENSFSGQIEMQGDIPVTSKENKRRHGLGLKSVKHSVEKYSGTIAFSAKRHWFSAVCAFPLPVSTIDTDRN